MKGAVHTQRNLPATFWQLPPGLQRFSAPGAAHSSISKPGNKSWEQQVTLKIHHLKNGQNKMTSTERRHIIFASRLNSSKNIYFISYSASPGSNMEQKIALKILPKAGSPVKQIQLREI